MSEELGRILQQMESVLFGLLSASDKSFEKMFYQQLCEQYNTLFGSEGVFRFELATTETGEKKLSAILFQGKPIEARSFSRVSYRVSKLSDGKPVSVSYSLLSGLCSIRSLLHALSQRGVVTSGGAPSFEYNSMAKTLLDFIAMLLTVFSGLEVHGRKDDSEYRQPFCYAIDRYGKEPDADLAILLLAHMGHNLFLYRGVLQAQSTTPGYQPIIDAYNAMIPEDRKDVQITGDSPAFSLVCARSPHGGEHRPGGYLPLPSSSPSAGAGGPIGS